MSSDNLLFQCFHICFSEVPHTMDELLYFLKSVIIPKHVFLQSIAKSRSNYLNLISYHCSITFFLNYFPSEPIFSKNHWNRLKYVFRAGTRKLSQKLPASIRSYLVFTYTDILISFRHFFKSKYVPFRSDHHSKQSSLFQSQHFKKTIFSFTVRSSDLFYSFKTFISTTLK